MIKILKKIDNLAIWMSVSALILITVVSCISVVGRYFFGTPIPDDLSISEKLMVFVFMPLAAVQSAREHVFVSLFSDWLSNRPKVVMETIGVIIGAIFFTLAAAASYVDFKDAYEVGAYTSGPLNIPHAPFKFFLFVAITLFSFRLIVDAVMMTAGLFTGKAVASLSDVSRLRDIEAD